MPSLAFALAAESGRGKRSGMIQQGIRPRWAAAGSGAGRRLRARKARKSPELLRGGGLIPFVCYSTNIVCSSANIRSSMIAVLCLKLYRASAIPTRRRAHPAMVPSQDTSKLNKLLAGLPQPDAERVLAHLEFVPLKLGSVLYETGDQPRSVYFPTDSIVSLLYVLENGDSAEIAMVGSEGMVGVASVTGGDFTSSRALVQSAGFALQLDKEVLKREFARGGPLQRALLRYVQALMTQVGQTAVCNRHHTVHQQLCRWLLLSLDRLPSNEVHMTQELIANMLGVRREGVTEAARKLQDAGMIKYSRGHITVLDRTKLESGVCECYAVVRKAFERLLGS